MKEALTIVFDFAFGVLGLGDIVVETREENVAVRGLMQSLGLQRIGSAGSAWGSKCQVYLWAIHAGI
jgi:RimJ/RimL family protein N-acetyltransferase